MKNLVFLYPDWNVLPDTLRFLSDCHTLTATESSNKKDKTRQNRYSRTLPAFHSDQKRYRDYFFCRIYHENEHSLGQLRMALRQLGAAGGLSGEGAAMNSRLLGQLEEVRRNFYLFIS